MGALGGQVGVVDGTIKNLARKHTRCRKLDDLVVGEIRDSIYASGPHTHRW